MIDIHTHLLPELDDGPVDDLASIAMARVAVEHGITEMVATPHAREDHGNLDAGAIRRDVGRLQALLDVEEIPLRVWPGAEVAIGPALELAYDDLRALTLGGKGALLLEVPHAGLPSIFETAVESLLGRGLRVVLAHPELNPDLQDDPDRLGRLVALGALAQVTATSLSPGRARHRTFAVDALARGWVHVVATDAHSAEWRPPTFEPAREAAGSLMDWLTRDVPRALLTGASVPERPDAPAAARPVRRARRFRLRR